MKRYFFIFLSLLTLSSASSQSFAWIDGEETGYEYNPTMVNYSVCASHDGTIWFGGLKERVTSYYQMMGSNFLIRYDEEGNRIENRLIDGILVITAMKCDPDGNLYVAGEFMDADIQFWDGTVLAWDGNSINSFAVRINSLGTVDWAVNLNTALGQYAPVSDMAWSDGKMYFAHNLWMSPYVTVADNAGGLSVVITHTNIGTITGIDFDSNGSLYCTGSCAGTANLFNGVWFFTPVLYNKYLVRYDTARVPLWVRFAEDVTCILPKVKVDQNNDIYWTGPLYNTSTFDTVTLEGPAWVNDFYLVKMNALGSALWGREVPQVLTGDATIGSLDILKVMPDNSVTIGGVTRGTLNWGSGVVSNTGSMNQGAWLLNFENDGTPQWTKTGQGDFSDLKSMDIDSSGNLYFTGICHDTVWFDNLNIYRTSFYYPYLAKLENTTTGIVENRGEGLTLVAPNPARDFITLLPDGQTVGPIEILDLFGKVVMKFNSGTRMNVSSLSPGIYFLQLRQEDKEVVTVKLVKQ